VGVADRPVTTDTSGMNRSIRMIVPRLAAGVVSLVALLALLLGAVPASAGEPCGPCRGCGHTAGGHDYGGTGCGPRYWGAVREDPHCVDPCDGCVRWRGCHGGRQAPDMLVPWQLPPGRGFLTAEQVGWRLGPCRTCGPGSSAAPCGSCGPCGNSLRAKHAVARPWRPVIDDVRPYVGEWGDWRPDLGPLGSWAGGLWPW
jgi:hypothetical protein